MTITSQLSDDSATLTIVIEGRFDFSSHQTFSQTYESLDQVPEQFIIDMQATSYLDSSALGMLLLLRDFAGGDQARISVINCNDDVKKIFAISNFEQLFDIH